MTGFKPQRAHLWQDGWDWRSCLGSRGAGRRRSVTAREGIDAGQREQKRQAGRFGAVAEGEEDGGAEVLDPVQEASHALWAQSDALS